MELEFDDAMVKRAIDGLAAGLERGAIHLTNTVKSQYLSGDPLNVRTGHLRRSITNSEVEKDAMGARTKVGTNVVYAAIHEFGGTIKDKNGKSVGRMPARPYMRPALEGESDKIEKIVGEEVRKAVGE